MTFGQPPSKPSAKDPSTVGSCEMWRNIAENAAIAGSQAEQFPWNQLRQSCLSITSK
jgi:hypothetical protein